MDMSAAAALLQGGGTSMDWAPGVAHGEAAGGGDEAAGSESDDVILSSDEEEEEDDGGWDGGEMYGRDLMVRRLRVLSSSKSRFKRPWMFWYSEENAVCRGNEGTCCWQGGGACC